MTAKKKATRRRLSSDWAAWIQKDKADVPPSSALANYYPVRKLISSQNGVLLSQPSQAARFTAKEARL